MIDETAIRAALEGVLGSEFGGLSVSRVGEQCSSVPGAAFFRTLLVRASTRKVNNAYSRATGMFEIYCLVPKDDLIDAAESLAASVIAAFLPHDRLLADLVRVVEAGILSDSFDNKNFEPDRIAGNSYLAVCAQIDWQVDQIGG